MKKFVVVLPLCLHKNNENTCKTKASVSRDQSGSFGLTAADCSVIDIAHTYNNLGESSRVVTIQAWPLRHITDLSGCGHLLSCGAVLTLVGVL